VPRRTTVRTFWTVAPDRMPKEEDGGGGHELARGQGIGQAEDAGPE